LEDQTTITSIIRQLEERLLLPNVRKSEKEVSALIAEEFVEYTSSGHIADKNQTIKGLLTEKPIQIALSDFKTRILTPDFVLATYLAVKQDSDGQPSFSLRSSIWKMIDDRWQIVFHQGTPTRR